MEIQQQLNEIKFQNDILFRSAFMQLLENCDAAIIDSLEDLMTYTNGKIYKLNAIYKY